MEEKTDKDTILKTKLRNEDGDVSNEQRRAAHQKILFENLNLQGKKTYQAGNTTKSVQKSKFFKFEAYRKEHLLPKQIENLRVVVDKRSESLVVPLYGFAVPLHVSTIKQIGKNDEGDFCYLRINLVVPTPATSLNFEDPNSTFVKALTFKTKDIGRMNDVVKDVNDMKKEYAKREQERREKDGLVGQDSLIETKGLGRSSILRDVNIRPALEGKRVSGDLEIHQNGIRYTSLRDQKVDVLFSNMQHLFFQGCVGEMIVVLHIRLFNEIIIGRKKTRDVQVYREVSDSFDETGNKRRKFRNGDEDEVAEEQEERIRRARLDKEFKTFAEKIADAVIPLILEPRQRRSRRSIPRLGIPRSPVPAACTPMPHDGLPSAPNRVAVPRPHDIRD